MRYFLMFIIVMITTFPTQSAVTTETCANRAGILVVGNNGTQYCMSRIAMNWWTAIGWCQTIGMRPFHYPTDCSCVGDNCPIATCPNISFGGNNTYLWSNSGLLATVAGQYSNSKKTEQHKALCVPIQ